MNENEKAVPLSTVFLTPDNPRAAGLAIAAYRRMIETARGKVRAASIDAPTAAARDVSQAADEALCYALGALDAAIELGNLEAKVESRPIFARPPPPNANEPAPRTLHPLQGRRFA